MLLLLIASSEIRLDVFARAFEALVANGGRSGTRHRIEGASEGSQSARLGKGFRRIERTEGGLNARRHGIYANRGRPRVMPLREGQTSDCRKPRAILPIQLKAIVPPGDRSDDVD